MKKIILNFKCLSILSLFLLPGFAYSGVIIPSTVSPDDTGIPLSSLSSVANEEEMMNFIDEAIVFMEGRYGASIDLETAVAMNQCRSGAETCYSHDRDEGAVYPYSFLDFLGGNGLIVDYDYPVEPDSLIGYYDGAYYFWGTNGTASEIVNSNYSFGMDEPLEYTTSGWLDGSVVVPLPGAFGFLVIAFSGLPLVKRIADSNYS